MGKQRFLYLTEHFLEPLLVVSGIVLYLLFSFWHSQLLSLLVIFTAITLGSYRLLQETVESLLKKQYALDYIAILAILVAVLTKEYLVAAIIALMVSTGRTLEEFGANQARRSLRGLAERIPQEVTVLLKDNKQKSLHISRVAKAITLVVRKGEVVGLDGLLLSEIGFLDESSLTGEVYTVEKVKGDIVRSGTVNKGETIFLQVTKTEKDSTYKKIVELVRKAEAEKAPLIRLADKYSTIFTLVTFLIAAFAYFYLGGLKGVLAVLVVATPCPLIIATPIALLGGVSASAKRKIIVKRLSVLEVLARVNTLVFDKTGTITLGKPKVVTFQVLNSQESAQKLLAVAEALERNSLHPVAKAIVDYCLAQKITHQNAQNIKETLGSGITGFVGGRSFSLNKLPADESGQMTVGLYEGQKLLAVFVLDDVIKNSSANILADLTHKGYRAYIFTGDKRKSAERILAKLKTNISLKADLSPEDKEKGIRTLQEKGNVVAMVGDGINDAPSLARSDVGMVFATNEQTAASEAADIVLLGSDFKMPYEAITIGKKAVTIALQSIRFGIGLSILAMVLASVGLIPPLVGAGIQEVLDVAVILNALRASR